MISSNFLCKKFNPDLSLKISEFLTYLHIYICKKFPALFSSSSKLRIASLVVVVVVGRRFL